MVCFQQSNGGQNDPSHTQRWNSVEIVKGSYGQDDCVNEIAEIKFDRPIPIKVNIAVTVCMSFYQLAFIGAVNFITWK